MRRTPLLLALALAFSASPLNAVEAEVRVSGLDSAPKMTGTTAAPLKLLPGGGQTSLPVGVDLKTVDGALGETPIMGPELLGLTPGLVRPGMPGAQLTVPLDGRLTAPEAGLTAPEAGLGAASAGEQNGKHTEDSLAAANRLVSNEDVEAGTGEERPVETLNDGGKKEFDGQKTETAQAPQAPKTVLGRLWNRTGGALGRSAKRMVPTSLIERFKAPATGLDQFGGPQELKLNFKGKLAYGTKWAFNMIGIGTLLQGAALLLQKVFVWQLHVSDSILQSTGRVELLARLGPKAIGAALSKSPFQFLFVQLPMATAWEEFSARLLSFGILWTVLAAVKPVTGALSKWLELVPDLFNLRKTVQTGLAVAGKVSSIAFPIAAIWSAVNFATSHFAAWGFSPYFASVHLSMGLALAYVAYRTRSLVTPFVAHYVYNLLTLGAGLLAVHFLMPMTAQIYALGLGLVGVAYLYYNVRTAMKARAQAKAQKKIAARAGMAAVPLLMAALMTSAVLGPAIHHDMTSQTVAAQAAKIWPAQDPQDTTKAQTPAPADTTQAAPQRITLSGAIDMMTEAVTAKAKPAIVKIFSGNGLGSGYIISPDGIVISNAHVTGAAKVGDVLKMEFSDGSTGEIKVLAFNHDKDIAILQLPKKEDGWPFVPLGDSKTVVEGQSVLAMGYPLGLPFTVTKGIISGLGGGRGSIYVQQLQTDAAINHGNSGGALLNMNGEVVGMNTAIASPTPNSGSIGIGFSIVSEDIKAALAQFQAAGNINTAWLGIVVNQADPAAPELGVAVEVVRPGSPAALAGLKSGDLILGVDKKVFPKGPHGLEALARAIAQHKPGDKMVVLVARQGDTAPFTATLADDPSAK